jgi:ribose 5-phosphate isomerase B
MKIAIGTDHAGFPLKQTVLDAVREAGHEPLDLGTDNATERVDFPDFAEKVGRAIQSGEAGRGIAICGSGVGMCVTANKLRGVYASVCHDTYSAHQGVEHDGMNVLCLGARIIGPEPAREIVLAFLEAQQMPDERFQKRIDKVRALEGE